MTLTLEDVGLDQDSLVLEALDFAVDQGLLDSAIGDALKFGNLLSNIGDPQTFYTGYLIGRRLDSPALAQASQMEITAFEAAIEQIKIQARLSIYARLTTEVPLEERTLERGEQVFENATGIVDAIFDPLLSDLGLLH
ncbi:MAG: hypothetical protein ABJV04_13955 [Aliiglaciecola sp.]|uniref:hypothetical protein n=1 Tax=Aliiglaciecola sp. TaxID=1872441 RepID=UPI003298B9EC